MNTTNRSDTDNHGAAAGGRDGENSLAIYFELNGLTLLRKIEEFNEYKFLHEGWDAHTAYNSTIVKNSGWFAQRGTNSFISDGYCPELNLIIELKHSDHRGTVEEKVFYDLYKITKGVYSSHPLVYIFTGNHAHLDERYRQFVDALEEAKETNEHARRVSVIFVKDMASDKEFFKALRAASKL